LAGVQGASISLRRPKISPKTNDKYDRILEAAIKIFAEQGFFQSTISQIAKEAGVTHGLVHHYFGTTEDLVARVIESEVEFGTELSIDHPFDTSTEGREVIRHALRHFFTEGTTSTFLIARAELNGYRPEKWISQDKPTALTLLAQRLAELQAEADPGGIRPDPTLVSAYIGAAIMGLIILHPWLMTAAGLRPEDYENRLDEIIDLAETFIAVAGGALPAQR